MSQEGKLCLSVFLVHAAIGHLSALPPFPAHMHTQTYTHLPGEAQLCRVELLLHLVLQEGLLAAIKLSLDMLQAMMRMTINPAQQRQEATHVPAGQR